MTHIRPRGIDQILRGFVMEGEVMPEWGDRPENVLDDAMRQAMLRLSAEIEDNPSFDFVAGMSLEHLGEQAAAATEALMQVQEDDGENRPSIYVQCYMLGFLVGQQYRHK